MLSIRNAFWDPFCRNHQGQFIARRGHITAKEYEFILQDQVHLNILVLFFFFLQNDKKKNLPYTQLNKFKRTFINTGINSDTYCGGPDLQI